MKSDLKDPTEKSRKVSPFVTYKVCIDKKLKLSLL